MTSKLGEKGSDGESWDRYFPQKKLESTIYDILDATGNKKIESNIDRIIDFVIELAKRNLK